MFFLLEYSEVNVEAHGGNISRFELLRTSFASLNHDEQIDGAENIIQVSPRRN